MKGASLRDALNSRGILISDGAMGSALFAKGLEPGDCPDALCLSHPEWIAEISASYRAAGADIIQTNTFGASPLKLAPYGLEEKTEEINREGVRIAREAADGALVAGECGPCGGLLEPYGDVSVEAVCAGFKRQAAELARAGADFILFETFTDLNEALLGLRAAKEVAPDLSVWVSLTFDPTPRGFFTMMGQTPAQAAVALEAAGADGVGSNCGNGIVAMTAIAREFRAATRLSVIIQSNAGLPEERGGGLHYPESPEFFGRHAPDLLEAGVTILGGCCGTTPEHIRTLRRAADEFERRKA